MDERGTRHPLPRLMTTNHNGPIRYQASHEWVHRDPHFFPIDVAMAGDDEEQASPPPNASPEATRYDWSSPEIEPSRHVTSEVTRESEEEGEHDDTDDGNQDATDRRAIIQRIDNGEKQAELAREFGVTRAAICHINKNRVEILARSTRPDVHAAARHPKRRMSTADIAARQRVRQIEQRDQHRYHHEQRQQAAPTPNLPPSVYRVRSHALDVHLATLQRHDTSTQVYRNVADRAIWILLEEALASAPTRVVEVASSDRSMCTGLVSMRPTCGMVVSEGGFPMLESFRSIQPDSPTGSITLDRTTNGDPSGIVLRKMRAPLNLREHSVFLLEPTCVSADEVCTAIQSLVAFGVVETNVFFVALVVSARAAAAICKKFPHVHIVVGAVEADTSGGDGEIMGHFVERYFDTTTIHHSTLGANADV